MAHLHEVRDTDKHFVIDPITMAITTESDKLKLMQGDHNSEIYTFEIPKVIEGHDMASCNRVEIHYNDISSDRANTSKDYHRVNDMKAAEDNPEMLVFSWLIHGNATKYAGALNFRIRFGCVDENGVYTYKKHTDIFKGITISDGFDNTAAVIEEYADAIAAWEAELDEQEARIANLEQNGTGGSVSEDQIAQAVSDYLEENPVDCNVNPVAKTEAMTQPVGIDENGQLWTAPTSGGAGGESAENADTLLGTLPMTISESNCYLLSENNATISTGNGAADLIDFSANVPTIGDKTYNGGAFEVLNKNTLKLSFENVGKNATAYVSIGFEVDKSYTIAARIVEKSGDIIRTKLPLIRANVTTGSVSQLSLNNSNVMQLKTFVAESKGITITLPTATGYLVGETHATIEVHVYEGELVEMPSGATFDILAGEKYNTDGYMGATLSEVDGKTVQVYKTNTSEAESETDNGGVIFFGDSILHYSDVTTRYANKTGKSVLNCAVGGTRMSASRDSSNSYYPLDMANIANAIASGDFSAQLNSSVVTSAFTTLATATISNYKAIVLEFGTNDFSAKVPFDGEDTTSIKGALKHILTSILTKYPNMRIIVLSTLQYITLGTGNESGIPTHDDGTVWTMNQTIKGVCESDEFCVPFVDMYHAFGQNGITRNTLNSDGVHLTSPNGAKRYADILIGKLNALGI